MKDLNRQSAEIIMGWKLHPKFVDRGDGFEDCWVTENNGFHTFAAYVKDWNPLHDMNQCMMVEQKVAEDGWQMKLYTAPVHHDKRFSVFFEKHKRSCWALSQYTPNEAILRAALAAAEAQEVAK